MPSTKHPRDVDHDWQFGAVLSQQVKHIVTEQLMIRPSVVMSCGCGEIKHVWAPPPEEHPDANFKSVLQ